MGVLDWLNFGRPREVAYTADELWEKISGDGYHHNYGTIYFSDGTRVRGTTFSMAGAYRAMTLLASVTAATPLDVVDLNGTPVPFQRLEAELEAQQHPKRHIARNWRRVMAAGKPDMRLDTFAFFEQMVLDLVNRGNVFLHPIMTAQHWGLEILRPAQAGHGAIADGYVRSLPMDNQWECLTLTGERKPVMVRDLIHISLPILGLEPSTQRIPLGMPLAYVVKDAVAGGKASDNYIVETVNSANRLGMKMELDRKLDGQTEVDSYYQFASRQKGSTKIFLVDGGVKLGELKSPSEMLKAVNEARSMQIDEVARAFGVPAPLIGQSSSAWAAGVEQLARVFLRFSARPFWWRRIESALTAALLPFGYRFEYNDTDFLRGDWPAWAALAGAATQSGVLSQEELRHAGGFPRRFPEGDTRLTTPYQGKIGGQEMDPNTGQPKK